MGRRYSNPYENAFEAGYRAASYGATRKGSGRRHSASYHSSRSYKSSYSADEIGREGESKIEDIIDSSTVGKILRNVYVPKCDSDETIECDIVFICQKGIFVFESKYYRNCKISGNENEEQWIADYGNRNYTFFNPIMQNNAHIRHLSNYLGIDRKYFYSVIVFADTVEWNGLEISSSSNVIKISKLKDKLQNMYKNISGIMNDNSILDIYNKLKAFSKVDRATKEKHKDDINSKYGKNQGNEFMKQFLSQEMIDEICEKQKEMWDQFSKMQEILKEQNKVHLEYTSRKETIEEPLKKLDKEHNDLFSMFISTNTAVDRKYRKLIETMRRDLCERNNKLNGEKREKVAQIKQIYQEKLETTIDKNEIIQIRIERDQLVQRTSMELKKTQIENCNNFENDKKPLMDEWNQLKAENQEKYKEKEIIIAEEKDKIMPEINEKLQQLKQEFVAIWQAQFESELPYWLR